MPASCESIITCLRFKICVSSDESLPAEDESQLPGRPNDGLLPLPLLMGTPVMDDDADDAFDDIDIFAKIILFCALQ